MWEKVQKGQGKRRTLFKNIPTDSPFGEKVDNLNRKDLDTIQMRKLEKLNDCWEKRVFKRGTKSTSKEGRRKDYDKRKNQGGSYDREHGNWKK